MPNAGGGGRAGRAGILAGPEGGTGPGRRLPL